MKKGDLSMGVIVGAAIALLVLVLLSVLVLNAGNRVNAGTSCEAVSGAFCELEDLDCGDGYITRNDNSCSIGEKCCVPFGS